MVDFKCGDLVKLKTDKYMNKKGVIVEVDLMPAIHIIEMLELDRGVTTFVDARESDIELVQKHYRLSND